MVREYYGARYVPKFMGLYDSTTEYEALCVVDNGQGTSYISKIPTPAGTPLTNATYWTVYGAASGAIIHLQNQIDTLDGEVEVIANKIDSASGKAIILTDSYGNYTNVNGKNIGEVAADISGVNVEFLHSGGCGFVGDGSNTFTALIDTHASNVNDITNIIVIGGANDYSYLTSHDNLVNAILSFCEHCRNRFPKLANVYIMASTIVFGTFPNYKGAFDRVFTARAYQDGALKANAIYVTNSQYIMHDTRLLISDFCHPTTSGVDTLGEYVAQVLKGAKALNVTKMLSESNILTLSSEMVGLGGEQSANYTTNHYFQNGTGIMSGSGGSLECLSFKTTTYVSSLVQHTLGTLNSSLFSLYDANNQGWTSIEGWMYTDIAHTRANAIRNALLFTIENNVIKFIIAYKTSDYECYGFLADPGSIVISGN